MSELCSMLTSWSTQSIWPSAATHRKSKTRYVKSFSLWKASTKKICSQVRQCRTHAHTHTHLQHAEPSTFACALWLCRMPDVSAAIPHTRKIPSALPGGGQFCLRCPSHPDSPMSPIAVAGLHSGHNMPRTTAESHEHSWLCCTTAYWQYHAKVHLQLNARDWLEYYFQLPRGSWMRSPRAANVTQKLCIWVCFILSL